ncbi:hypothetical protein LP419_37010 [Massilia sp. H-1]|nr:hypothetical protein LP419_37010 [Massilia sp. H-1]
MLTVADDQDIGADGAVIVLNMDEQRIAFDIDIAAAQCAPDAVEQAAAPGQERAMSAARPGFGSALGRRLAQTSILTAAAALLVASLALILVQFLALRAALADDLRVQARIIGINSSAALMFADARVDEETLAGLAVSPSVAAASIFDGRGATLAHYERHTAKPLAAPACRRQSRFRHRYRLQPSRGGRAGAGQQPANRRDRHPRHARRPVRAPGHVRQA